jgi:hypothetical protein
VDSAVLPDGRRPAAIAQISITGDMHTNEWTARLHGSAFAQTEEPRKIPIRSRGKRACGASACLAESSGA